MLNIIDSLAKVAAPSDSSNFDYREDADSVCITKPKPGFMGLLFEDNILMVDYKRAMSFRVRYGNLGLHKNPKLFSAKHRFPRDLLTEYFRENKDNPYALEYVMGRIASRMDVTTELTQVPPMQIRYTSEAQRDATLRMLIEKAQQCDTVFSRPLADSRISTFIRSEDRCQFSHVGIYLGDGETLDAGIDRVTRNSLYELGQQSHLALYRLRQSIPDDKKKMMMESAQKMIGGKYNWLGVLEVYLRSKFKLPINPTKPSVSTLLFSDAYQLVDYV